MKNQTTFKKRVFTPASWFRGLWEFTTSLPRAGRLNRRREIDWAFAEKIMLAVTSVNDCRYCTWLHSDLALRSGADEPVVAALLSGQGESKISDYERPAVLYAYHYAETNRAPSPAKQKELTDFYGEQRAADIHTFIRLIYFGNLSGNTFDSFLHRIRGGESDSPNSLVFEAVVAAVSAPALLGIARRFRKPVLTAA